MRDCSAVRLAWAVVDGELAPVSAYAHLPPAARPAAACPVCGGAVTLKLGEQRMHHAAHQPGVRCVVEAGETALHLNAKCALWAALRAAAAAEAELRVRVRCAARGRDPSTGRVARCGATETTSLVRGWDRVTVETAVGATRPDLTLWRDGRPVAVLEVVVSHAVDAAKARALAALAIPWAEVRPAPDAPLVAWLPPELAHWTPAEPLPARQLGTSRGVGGAWRCPSHARAAEAAERRRANGLRPWLARVVDVYAPDGRHARDVLYMEAELRAGRVVAVRLQHARDDDVLAKATRPERARTKRELHDAFVRWCGRLRARGLRVDSPMPWVPARQLAGPGGGDAGGPGWRVHELRFPRRYRYDREAGRWVGITDAAGERRGWVG